MAELAPTLQNLVDQPEIEWIFVGGKGGVGKTTTSSSLAVLMAKHRKNVLIISTDPAHNLSDAFDQKFTSKPTQVNGIENLFAMEVDPTIDPDKFEVDMLGVKPDKNIQSFLSEIISSTPGIDEAMSFAELMKNINTMEYSTIIFDTAPTGHTLRLLNFPDILEKGLGKLVGLKQKFNSLFTQFQSVTGSMQEQDPEELHDKIFTQMEAMKKIVEQVNGQIKNPEKCTFVGVCIPEFLSMYETERLCQELAKHEVDIHNIVINNVLYPEGDCKLCNARRKMQQKYIDQIVDLYDDFHVVMMPLLEEEVRGIKDLTSFGNSLIKAEKPQVTK